MALLLFVLLAVASGMCDPNSTAPVCNSAASFYLPHQPFVGCAAPQTCDTTANCCLTAVGRFACAGTCATPPWVWSLVALSVLAVVLLASGYACQRWSKRRSRHTVLQPTDDGSGEEDNVEERQNH